MRNLGAAVSWVASGVCFTNSWWSQFILRDPVYGGIFLVMGFAMVIVALLFGRDER